MVLNILVSATHRKMFNIDKMTKAGKVEKQNSTKFFFISKDLKCETFMNLNKHL